LVDKAELNPDQAEKVIAALGACKNLHDLEAVEPIDQPKIELNDGGTYTVRARNRFQPVRSARPSCPSC